MVFCGQFFAKMLISKIQSSVEGIYAVQCTLNLHSCSQTCQNTHSANGFSSVETPESHFNNFKLQKYRIEIDPKLRVEWEILIFVCVWKIVDLVCDTQIWYDMSSEWIFICSYNFACCIFSYIRFVHITAFTLDPTHFWSYFSQTAYRIIVVVFSPLPFTICHWSFFTSKSI